jgi:hypothetical protein
VSDPWDVPPFSGRGDDSAEAIYAAKGKAVSEWENIEVALSHLFSVFSGLAWDSREGYQRYGELLAFRDRASRLEAMGHTFLIRHCNQELDNTFDGQLERVRGFSARRNEITHSVVRNILVMSGYKVSDGWQQRRHTYQFLLVPPIYNERKYSESNKPAFIYNSDDIRTFSEHFLQLRVETDTLVARLVTL